MKKYSGSLEKLRFIIDQREANELSVGAVKSVEGIRRDPEDHLKDDYRQNFAVDVDRILHSLAYTRYFDKTQVFYLIKNDHITHRMLHVQLVSKVARTIGRFLGLNEDLIEAIAIGHDIGHAPFGHDGERVLSEICSRYNIGQFHHSVQSVQFLEKVEHKGKGWNLCLQTLDGILCHDGEAHNTVLIPEKEKSFQHLENEIKLKKAGDRTKFFPMSLEGCVVRLSDTVSYIGRDIEDAIRLNIIQRSELPSKSVAFLGDTNGTIVYSLVTDIIASSHEKPHISFSPEVSNALKVMKKFNYERIYMNPVIKEDAAKIKELFKVMFDRFYEDIMKKDLSSPIFTRFIDGMADEYEGNQKPEEIVRDFIAGMTDRYFLSQVPEKSRPSPRVI
jgi:dGTPase